MFTKQDLIEELEVQRDHAETLEQWEELTYQVIQLQQEVDIEAMIDYNATSFILGL